MTGTEVKDLWAEITCDDFFLSGKCIVVLCHCGECCVTVLCYVQWQSMVKSVPPVLCLDGRRDIPGISTRHYWLWNNCRALSRLSLKPREGIRS
jgi:hypothetical protein